MTFGTVYELISVHPAGRPRRKRANAQG